MAKISKAQWDKYKAVINDFHNDANQDSVLWYKWSKGIPRYGEDNEGTLQPPITLHGLMNYNYFRAWPLTGYTITGEYDKQSAVLILNIDYLNKIGLADSTGKLDYHQDKDVFVHRGDLYLPTGDTLVSQAHGEPLLFVIILKRQENIPYPLPDEAAH